MGKHWSYQVYKFLLIHRWRDLNWRICVSRRRQWHSQEEWGGRKLLRFQRNKAMHILWESSFSRVLEVPWLLIFLRRAWNYHLLFADQNCVKGFYESHYFQSELLKMWNVYGKQELEVLSILSSQLYRSCCVFADVFIVKLSFILPSMCYRPESFSTPPMNWFYSPEHWYFPKLNLFFLSQLSSLFTLQNVPVSQILRFMFLQTNWDHRTFLILGCVCVFTTHLSFHILCYVLNCPFDVFYPPYYIK